MDPIVTLSLLVMRRKLKGLFHPGCLARVVSLFASVAAIFMVHENGDEQRQAKRRHVQGMLDERDPLRNLLKQRMNYDSWQI